MERHERLGIRHQVLKKLRDAFLYGSEPTFTLSSGRKSRYYIDCKKVTLDPEGAFLIARLVLDAIADDEVDAIGGMTLGADPIAVAVAVVSYQEDRPIAAFVVRKEPKAHGATSYIEATSRGFVSWWSTTCSPAARRPSAPSASSRRPAASSSRSLRWWTARKAAATDSPRRGIRSKRCSPSRTCSRPERRSVLPSGGRAGHARDVV
jgi:hypothetical protein